MRKRLRSSLLIATFLLAGALPVSQAQAVIDGQSADDSEWQSAAAILHSDLPTDKFASFCSGTLVQPRIVLTAGHCAEAINSVGEADVWVGSHTIGGQGGKRIAIEEVALAPGWKERLVNDVALLLLKEPAPNGVPLMPLLAPAEAGALTDGAPAKITGWGRTTVYGNPPDSLQEGDTEIVGDDNCKTAWEQGGAGGFYGFKDFDFSPTTLCINSPDPSNALTCYGDSGGLVAVFVGGEWKQAGVISTGGFECIHEEPPTVSIRVDLLHEFITATNHVWRPVAEKRPEISGTLKAGNTVECGSDQWHNTPTEFTVTWYRADEAQPFQIQFVPPVNSASLVNGVTTSALITVGKSRSYHINESDVGHELICRIRGRNAGGVGTTQTLPTAKVAAADEKPSNQQSSSSTTTPAASPADKEAPQAALASRRCSKRRCAIDVLVADGENSSGVVELRSNMRRCTKGKTKTKKGQSCRKQRPVVVRAARISTNLWRLLTPRLAKGRNLISLRAVDRAGNVQRQATEIVIDGK